MKKRLRKKLRVLEFQEMGFKVNFDLHLPETDAAQFAFWDKLVAEVESNGLLIGGGLDDFFVQANSRRSATETDRQAIETWLLQQPEVSAVTIGPLIDAWYGSSDQ